MPKSIKKNDLFGKEYIQHYDDNYNEIGTSVVKENFTGIKYIQHYDTNGNETGRSEFIENWFGEEYLQHFDTNFQETGHSKEKESFLGDKYTEHYDNDYNVTGQTKNKEGFFGDKYRETTLRSQQPKNTDSESSVGVLLGMFVRMFGVEKGLMYYRILLLSFWGGIIYIVITMILPLFIINISIIGLIIGLLKRERSKYIFLISVVGLIFLIFDYNNGWLTKFLVEHSPSFNNKIGFFLYSNIIAGLVSAYFFIRNILNEKKPEEIAEGEFSKRNLVIMGSLLLVGCLTIGGQKYYENDKAFLSGNPITETGATNPSPNKNIGEILFTGSVGKLKANYILAWNADGSLNGTYFYPTRPNVIYAIKGKDLGNGNIELTEYTEGIISANCYLSLNGNCYTGQMKNTDGRQFKMVMCKTDNEISIKNNNSSVQGPIDNLFKAWATLDFNFYMNQWDQNSSQLSKKFETRNYPKIKNNRQSLFSRLSSVEVINYDIIKLTQDSKDEATIIVTYSMHFKFKNGNLISELDTTEKYLLRYDSQESRWLIYKNFDYID
jgi:hypothetical protein